MLLKLTDFRSIGLLVCDMNKTITGHICPNINEIGAEIYFAGIAAVLVDRIALVQRDNGTLASADRRTCISTNRTHQFVHSVGVHTYVNIYMSQVRRTCA